MKGENFVEVDSVPRVARLQFEAVRADTDFGRGWQVDYDLVIPLQDGDIRGKATHKSAKVRQRPKNHRLSWLDSDNCKHSPMGRTKVGTEKATYPIYVGASGEYIDLPFRDGVHCSWDNALLKLPVYYIVGGKAYLLTFKPQEGAR